MHFKNSKQEQKSAISTLNNSVQKKEKEKNTERNIEEEEKQNKDLCVIKELQERF